MDTTSDFSHEEAQEEKERFDYDKCIASEDARLREDSAF